MPAGITRIDHPVIAVHDMDEAHRIYDRLGFTIPPLGSHLEWGTGNWCIMFPDDYLELRGIADASRYTHHLDVFLAERGEGLMGVAFGTLDADESMETARGSGLEPIEIKQLTRRFALPEGDAFPKFRVVYLSEKDAPGLLTTVICGHLTPEIIRRPEWLCHPNGVTGVASVTTVVDDPGAAADAYERLLGDGAVSQIEGGLRLSPREGAVIDVLSPERAAELGYGEPGERPFMPACTLVVDDLRKSKAVLTGNGVPFEERGSEIMIGPQHTCGLFLTLGQDRHG